MTVSLYDLECDTVCVRCTIMQYERWTVSNLGYIQHLWSHKICDSKTMCGEQIHRSGRNTASKNQICDRCVKAALKKGKI